MPKPAIPKPAIPKPAVPKPVVPKPVAPNAGAPKPAVPKPAVAPPGVPKPAVAPPGVAPPAVAPPGVAPPGVAPPGVAPPGVPKPAVAPPGVVPPVPGNPDPAEPNDRLPGAALRPAPDPNTPTTLNAANLTGQDVADLYFQYTGKRVLVSQEASQGEISFIVPGQMTYAEASTILEKKLALEGYALIPDGDDPSLMKLVLAASQAGAKQQKLDVLDDLSNLEGPSDRIVTYVMPMEYLKPDEALRAFQAVVQQFGPAGTVAAIPNAGSVVVTANIPIIRTLAELKKRIDVPAARVGTKFVEVTYADVEELSDKLNEIFNNQRQSQQTARVQRTNTGATPPIPGGITPAGTTPGAGSSGEETPINIIPQPRTSRIFLMGRPVDIVFVEGLIADFDAPSSKRNFLRLKLRYLPVTEFIPVAADALQRTLETGGAGGGGASRRPTGTTGRATSPSSRNQLGQTGRTTGATGGAGGGGGARAQLAQQDFQTAPESILIGKTLLVGDNISNSIVVNGPPHHIEVVKDLVKELDQPSEQVAITAVFGRYDLGKDRNFGLDVATLVKGNQGFTGAVQNRNGVPSVIDPNSFLDLSGLLGAGGAAGGGLSAYAVIGNNFGLFVNALESNRNFTAISRPTIFTTNNGTARISSGSRIAVPTSTFQGGTNTGFSTNVEFRDIVLELEVRPLVNSADEVTLEISLVRDAIGEDRTIQGFGNVPDITTDEIATTVTVPNRSTIVLGGLITESENQTKDGLPFLSSLPLIGPLFGSGRKDVSRQELVILIHPSILTNEPQLESYQQQYDAKSRVAPKARNSVEGSGVLPPRGAYTPNVGKAVPVLEARGSWSENSGRAVTSPTHRAMRNKRRR